MTLENKKVIIPVWDLETDELVDLEINQSDLDAMDDAQREVELRRKEAMEYDSQAWEYARDD